MEHMASKLGEDPIEFRIKNMLKEGDYRNFLQFSHFVARGMSRKDFFLLFPLIGSRMHILFVFLGFLKLP